MGVLAHESSSRPADLARRVRRLEIRAKRLVAERLIGQYGSVFRGRGLEFSEVREYQPGDDIRIIDWNVTARMGVPFVKKFVEERELTVLIVTDISASQQFGTASVTKAELATELSALLAFAAVASNDLVGLLTFTDRIETFVPPAKGSRHALRLVRELLGARPAGRGTDIGAALNYVQRALARRAIVFLISDFMDDGFEAILRSTAYRHDVIALALGDPREVSLASIGLVEVEDPETGERTWLDTTDKRVRRGFEEQALAALSERGHVLKSLGVDVVSLSTDQDYIAPLTAYLQARARRR
ncbi:MAG: DUF58 domain-containing protein [Chloroflexi bacterium]|nr:DUF58 domain-containing protein [Chloroflexota bacterium]